MAGNTTNSAIRNWMAPVVRASFTVVGCIAGALIFNYLLFRAANLPFLWTGWSARLPLLW